MKTLKLYIFFFLILSDVVFSQSGWSWVYPTPQGNDLKSIDITPDGSIHIAGNSGTILMSTNSSVTWNVKLNNSLYTGWYNKISFIDNYTGWTVGQDWGLSFTSNHGVIWNIRALNNSDIMNDIFQLNRDTAWICGTGCKIVRTTNNWLSYTSQIYNPGSSTHLKSIVFKDRNTGFCVGGSPGSVVYTTQNGGNNWYLNPSPVIRTLLDIQYLHPDLLFMTSESGEVIRSSNSGANWIVTLLSPNIPLNELYFVNTLTGWIVGNDGKIFRTTDSGMNWIEQNSSTSNNLNTVKFINVNTGYAAGENGIILKTTNSGTNWMLLTEYFEISENPGIYSMKFLNADTGYFFGYDGLIGKSTNSGTTWVKQNANTTTNLMRSSVIDVNNAWVAGTDGTLISTSNGGSNWNLRNSPVNTRITGMHFTDLNTGYLLTQLPQRIFKTTDGGGTWNTKRSSLITQFGNNVYFVNSSLGFIVSNSGLILRTDNGANTWTSYQYNPSYDLYDVYFINNNTGWVCGYAGTILKTTDSGQNWILQSSGGHPLLKLFFIDENYGWAVGLYGSQFRTTNSGTNWQSVLSGTDMWIQDICFVDRNTGWMVGNGVLKTTNGGSLVAVNNNNQYTPLQFSLQQNYPNPFNPVTNIKFQIPLSRGVSVGRGVFTKLIIYDLTGRLVTTLVNEQLQPGSYSVDWDGTGYASGVYFYSLVTSEFTETKRMVLIR